MSGGGKEPDLALSKQGLEAITKGLRGAIDELREIAWASDAAMGAGFEELSLTGMEMGHGGLSKDFEDFCERWEWGVRALIQNASQLAQKAGLAAGTQWEEEQYIAGTFKVAANSVAGNPHLTEDEVVKKDWDELFSEETYTPDYSAESFKEGWNESKQTWDSTADAIREKSSVSEVVQQSAKHKEGRD
ncbi:hypothetical protein [Streptomyces coffeae]|uniref:WXG100 family type VII secretion target n=1 Tax=Streptomyces coffeae TaxID=621382 RepID=A0ABS1N995_9ACTN|nr:hypothetical protein [Streptomyces coffeae]MBL1096657.1 hypothetical protein [Streptomyces coffeae]